MKKYAVVISRSNTGDVYVIDSEFVKEFTLHEYRFGGYADTEDEANDLAESFCEGRGI